MISLKRKAYISLAVSIVLVFGVLVFDFWILLPRLVFAASEITNLRRELQLIETRTHNYGALQKEVARTQAMRSLIVTSYPLLSATSALDVFYFLEESAKKTGNIIDLDVREATPTTFPITLNGSFNGLVAFLARLETTPMKINMLHIASSTSREGPGPLPGPPVSLITTTLEAIPFLPSLAHSSP